MRLKLRKIGNSLGVIIPSNVITSYKEGDEIELNVITKSNKESKGTKKPRAKSKGSKLVFNVKRGVYEKV